MADDVFETVLSVGAAIVTIAVVVIVLTQFFGTVSLAGSTPYSEDVRVVDSSATLGSPEGATLTDHSVTMTRGTALSLDGTDDADASLPSGVDVSGETWTACTHARVDSHIVGTSTNRTLLKFNGATVYYDGTAGATGNWTVHYFDTGNRTSTEASLNASAPTGLTTVCFERDGTSLELARNSSATDTATVPASGKVSVPPLDNWNGTIDETRVWDYAHNTSQRSEFVQNGSLAIAGNPPEVRVMFDSKRNPDSVPGYWSGSSVDISGGSIVEGGVGAPTVDEGEEVSVGGPGGRTVRVDDSTFLEATGEIVFVDATGQAFGAIMATLKRIGGAALSLLVIGLIVMAARAMLDPLGGF